MNTVLVVSIVVSIVVILVLVLIYFYQSKKNITTSLPPSPLTENGNKTCQFEGEDLYNNKVYKWDGTQVKINPTNVLCNECNQYLFKDEKGCSSYIFDKNENSRQTVDSGVCTVNAKALSKPCPF